ncbi:MAG: hypothetical protein FWD49_02475 [Firmicutes bacterium]|nr:hypothetical protein [Bacillota bacterium]
MEKTMKINFIGMECLVDKLSDNTYDLNFNGRKILNVALIFTASFDGNFGGVLFVRKGFGDTAIAFDGQVYCCQIINDPTNIIIQTIGTDTKLARAISAAFESETGNKLPT